MCPTNHAINHEPATRRFAAAPSGLTCQWMHAFRPHTQSVVCFSLSDFRALHDITLCCCIAIWSHCQWLFRQNAADGHSIVLSQLRRYKYNLISGRNCYYVAVVGGICVNIRKAKVETKGTEGKVHTSIRGADINYRDKKRHMFTTSRRPRDQKGSVNWR